MFRFAIRRTAMASFPKRLSSSPRVFAKCFRESILRWPFPGPGPSGKPKMGWLTSDRFRSFRVIFSLSTSAATASPTALFPRKSSATRFCSGRIPRRASSVSTANDNYRKVELPLLDLVTARAQQSYYSFAAAHVAGASDDEVSLAALDVAFDFWNPLAISRGDDPVRESRKVLKGRVQVTRQGIGVTAPPGVEHGSATKIGSAQVYEMNQQES